MELTDKIKTQIKLTKRAILEYCKQGINLYERRIEEAYNERSELIERKNEFPANTNVLDKLKEYEGKEVAYVTYFGEKEKGVYKLHGQTHIGFKGMAYPIIADRCGLCEIRDAKTNEVIYENHYQDNLTTIQAGYVLGYEPALERNKKEVEFTKQLLEQAQKKYVETLEEISTKEEKLPEVIRRIPPLVPEKYVDRFLASFIPSYFENPEVCTENTIKLMEELHKGTKMEKVAEMANSFEKNNSNEDFAAFNHSVLYKCPRGYELLKAIKSDYIWNKAPLDFSEKHYGGEGKE